MDKIAAIRAYYDCFKERDREGLERLLTPGFRHVSPFAVYEDRDRMLDEIWPAVGRSWAVDLEIFGSGAEYVTCYRHAGEGATRLAEYIRFEDDQIAEIKVFLPSDPAT